MKKLLLVTLLLSNHLLTATASPTQTPITKSSILQTALVPYLESQDCSTQYQSSQEQLAEIQEELAQANSEIQSLIDNCSVSSCESILESTQDLLSDTDQLLQTTESRLDATLVELSDCESILESTVEVLDVTRAEFSATDSILDSTQDELIDTQELLSQTDSLLDSTQDELIDTQDLLSASDSIIDQATDLINDPAIPNASAIDAIMSDLFGYTPTAIDSLITDPLVPRIQDGLLPYLQAALEKLGDYSKIVKVSAGQDHLIVLTQAGKVYGAGDDFYLGVGSSVSYRPILTAMLGEGTSGVTDIAAGVFHSVILKNGKVYATGVNTRGQLGIGTSGDTKLTLTEMAGEGMSGVTAIAAGGEHTLVLKSGAVYGAGDCTSGQLGLGFFTNDPQKYLVPMIGEGTSGVVALATGEYYSLILKDTSAVYGCGTAGDGQLGMGSVGSGDIIATTTAMIGEGEAGVDAIAAGYTHSLVLKGDKVYGAGTNSSGELGIGTSAVSPIYTLTAAVGEGASGVTAIACGFKNSYLLKDNKAYAVGDNSRGQLGIGITSNDFITSFTAMIGEGLSGVTDITAGQNFAAIVKDDKAYSVGYNDAGELGIGTFDNVNVLTKSQRQL